MKNLLAYLVSISLSVAALSQEHTPELLKEPSGWAFERFNLPPSFAPTIPYQGVEELRFAPGMFNKDTASYFAYAFIAQLDNVSMISQNDISDYLLKYYKGLCSTVAKDRNLVVDTTRITAAVEKKKGLANEIIYNASVNVFGVFADGAPVKLNMEVKVLMNTAAKKTYLIFIASPREKTDAIWKKLYAIQKSFAIPK